jgi:putative PIN family toxin of toxin-antitoxin system
VAGRPLRINAGPGPMRIMLDTNLFLTYFLPPADPRRTIFRLIDHLLAGSAQLVLPEELVDEIFQMIRTKPYFRQRITEQGARGVIANLRAEAVVPPRLADIPDIGRDPKDDYLLAHAILERVDYLVTGDRDLLALDGEVDPLRIITAAAFLQLLEVDQSTEP